jgi:hypothetical protein
VLFFKTLVALHGYQKVEFHVDFKVVVNTLNSDCFKGVASWRLIQKFRRLLELEWEVRVCHCHSYYKANICADKLANIGCEHEPELMINEQYPSFFFFSFNYS